MINQKNANYRKPAFAKGLAPFPKTILGIESVVYNRSFQDYNKLYEDAGTVFFMDIDEPIESNKDLLFLASLMKEYQLSHFLILTTRAGFHVVSFDIMRHKVGYYELFQEFNDRYNIDYEYSYKWILRLSPKGRNQDISFYTFLTNSDIRGNQFSINHFLLYHRYFNIPDIFVYTLCAGQKMIKGHVKTVKYLTWNWDFDPKEL